MSIVRRYFYRVDLDPGFRVLDPNEAELLRYEAVDEVFEQRYGSDSDEHRPFLALVQGYGGRGVDEGLKQIVLKLHSFRKPSPTLGNGWTGPLPCIDRWKRHWLAWGRQGIGSGHHMSLGHKMGLGHSTSLPHRISVRPRMSREHGMRPGHLMPVRHRPIPGRRISLGPTIGLGPKTTLGPSMTWAGWCWPYLGRPCSWNTLRRN